MKKLLLLMGVATMLAFSLVLAIIFFSAYASESKSVIVHIDRYGESQIEFILLSILLPLNLISTVATARYFSRETGITNNVIT